MNEKSVFKCEMHSTLKLGLECQCSVCFQIQQARLENACNLTLLFYSPGAWTPQKRNEWNLLLNSLLGLPENRESQSYHYKFGNLQRTNEATTRNLCDAIRAALLHDQPNMSLEQFCEKGTTE